MALRTPISRVRSVTETSMMFMTPTPPTMRPTLRDGDHEDDQAAGELAPEPGERVGTEDFEVIGQLDSDLTADTQYLANLFLDQRLVFLVVVLDGLSTCP